jgi:hypothetical protein
MGINPSSGSGPNQDDPLNLSALFSAYISSDPDRERDQRLEVAVALACGDVSEFGKVSVDKVLSRLYKGHHQIRAEVKKLFESCEGDLTNFKHNLHKLGFILDSARKCGDERTCPVAIGAISQLALSEAAIRLSVFILVGQVDGFNAKVESSIINPYYKEILVACERIREINGQEYLSSHEKKLDIDEIYSGMRNKARAVMGELDDEVNNLVSLLRPASKSAIEQLLRKCSPKIMIEHRGRGSDRKLINSVCEAIEEVFLDLISEVKNSKTVQIELALSGLKIEVESSKAIEPEEDSFLHKCLSYLRRNA